MAEGADIRIPSKEGEVITLDTPMLLTANRAAAQNGYNRQLDQDWLVANLDPDGTHVVSFYLPHEHAAGQQVAPHWRLKLLMKVRNREKPFDAMLDVPDNVFRALTRMRKTEAGWEPVINLDAHRGYGKNSSGSGSGETLHEMLAKEGLKLMTGYKDAAGEVQVGDPPNGEEEVVWTEPLEGAA
jgi:hypothetical protein